MDGWKEGRDGWLDGLMDEQINGWYEGMDACIRWIRMGLDK